MSSDGYALAPGSIIPVCTASGCSAADILHAPAAGPPTVRFIRALASLDPNVLALSAGSFVESSAPAPRPCDSPCRRVAA